MNVRFLKDLRDTSDWPFSSDFVFRVDGSLVSTSDTAFDELMRDVSGVDTTVYLGPGVWKTRGVAGDNLGVNDAPGWRMQSGMRLVGAGRRSTTLQLVACNEQHGAVVVGSCKVMEGKPTRARDMWVSDLSVDGNARELSAGDLSAPWFIQGVQLWGVGGCRVERVDAGNVCGMGANSSFPPNENFVLCVNSPAGDSRDNLIHDCSVVDFYNPSGKGACSAISLNCWEAGTISGEISDCFVELNGERAAEFGAEFAYNLSHGKGVVLTRNRSVGAQRGFNNDTHDNYDLEVSWNRFDLPPGCCVGVLLQKGNKGSRFFANTILVKSAGSCGYIVDRAGESNDIVLESNRVVGVGAWKGTAYSYNLNDCLDPAKVPRGVTMIDNVIVPPAAGELVELIPPAAIPQTA